MAKIRMYTSRLVKKHRRAVNARRGKCKTKQKEAALATAFGSALEVQGNSQIAIAAGYETVRDWIAAGMPEPLFN